MTSPLHFVRGVAFPTSLDVWLFGDPLFTMLGVKKLFSQHTTINMCVVLVGNVCFFGGLVSSSYAH